MFHRVLRCFSSPGWQRNHYVFMFRRLVLPVAGFPIRKSSDQSLLAAPRSLSQLSTSFIASDCLGIHRAPFVA